MQTRKIVKIVMDTGCEMTFQGSDSILVLEAAYQWLGKKGEWFPKARVTQVTVDGRRIA